MVGALSDDQKQTSTAAAVTSVIVVTKRVSTP